MTEFFHRLSRFALPTLAFLLSFAGLIRNFEFSAIINLAVPVGLASAVIYLMRDTKEKHVDGKALLYPSEAVQQARKALAQMGEPGFELWAQLKVPNEYKSKGIFIMGEQGSGKTVYLLYLIEKALCDPLAKAVIHDFKMDIYPFLLRHLKIPESQVKLLHPYDKRASGWNIQADIEDEDTAEEVASAFIEKGDSKNIFFPKSARNIVKAILTYYLYRSEENSEFRWGLIHVVEALRKRERILAMIEAYPVLEYAKDALQNDDVRATIFADFGKIETVATMWNQPDKELVSLKAWRRKKEREILVLGTDTKRETTCKLLNRALWAMLSKQVIDQSAPKIGDMWFFLDEFHAMGKLEGLETFVSVARSRKGNIVLAGQDINQLLMPDMYGQHGTNIILQGCSTQIYFRCSGDASRWASQQIGNQWLMKQSTSRGISGGNVQSGIGEDEKQEAVVKPEAIQQLQKCTPQRPQLDAIITTFLDDPVRYPMPFRAFGNVWAKPKIEEDYQPEDRRERMRPQPMSKERLIALGLEKEEEQPNEQDKKINSQTRRRTFKPRTSRA